MTHIISCILPRKIRDSLSACAPRLWEPRGRFSDWGSWWGPGERSRSVESALDAICFTDDELTTRGLWHVAAKLYVKGLYVQYCDNGPLKFLNRPGRGEDAKRHRAGSN